MTLGRVYPAVVGHILCSQDSCTALICSLLPRPHNLALRQGAHVLERACGSEKKAELNVIFQQCLWGQS